MKTDEQLKQENPELYRVAREGGTEAPFVGKYVDEKADGMYHCAVCGAALFESDTKFDSGSGWPSFAQPVKLSRSYVYILRMSNGQFYTGSTINLRNRIKDHENGKVLSTSKYLPVKLIHFEAFGTESEARAREKKLKQHGRSYQLLKESIADNEEISLAGFTDPVNRQSVTLIEDNSHGMRRTEVRCAKCNAHLGHVFPDGPRIHRPDGTTKTCDRFCINSVSLELKEK